jgi:hypothetical protein
MEPKPALSEALAKDTERWIIAKSGNVEIPAYRLSDGRICICYYEGGQRERRLFRNEGKAKREAALVAAKINAGHQGALQLSNADRDSYLVAMRHLDATRTPLHIAAEEYAVARANASALPTSLKIVFRRRSFSQPGRKGGNHPPPRVLRRL